MNRYPAWKYALLVIALLVGLVYTLPNVFGEAPAVQVSSGKATLKLDASMAPRIQEILTKASLKADFVQAGGGIDDGGDEVVPREQQIKCSPDEAAHQDDGKENVGVDHGRIPPECRSLKRKRRELFRVSEPEA